MSDEVLARTQAADKLDSLAETAELMGDPDGAHRLREQASTCRLRAMELLDDTAGNIGDDTANDTANDTAENITDDTANDTAENITDDITE